MGGSSSKEERKAIDTNGNVNNKIIIQEADDIHDQLLTGQKLLIATYVLVILEIIKFGAYIFVNFKRNLKKKYTNNNV